MILIADSGSTKTDWRMIASNGQISQYHTQGINPFYMDSESIQNSLKEELDISKPNLVSKLFFYGAGCSSESKISIVTIALRTLFPNAEIQVNHDLLAAARAACGKSSGIAAILGTGSNSCVFNGIEIKDSISSLGFLLGDEGSGGYIGKLITQDYYYRNMPKDVQQSFERKIGMNSEVFLSFIYKEQYPNRYLAQFSKWLFQQKNEVYKVRLVSKAFDDFFKNHICKYSDYRSYSLNCVGSVAYYYQNILSDIAEKHEVQLGRIIESPIAALTLYHTDID